MLKKIFKEKFYFSLDIGTQTLKAAAILVKDPNAIEVLGVSENVTYGLHDSNVQDLGSFSECIYNTIHKLSSGLQIKVKDVEIGIGSSLINVRPTATTIPLTDKGSKVISKRDVFKVNEQARLLGIKIDEEIVHHLSQSYTVDDVNSILNPMGLYGRKLGISSLLMVIQENKLRNISKAIHQAGFEVGHMFFNSYVSAEHILTNDKKMEGCVFIDMGFKTTNVFIFKDGGLKFFEQIELGGFSFTQSIASKLGIPFDLAEDMKKSHATAIFSETQQDEEILLKRESQYIPIKRADIYQAIEPVINDFTIALHAVLDRSKLYSHLPQGMVFIGGGALLPGLIEKIHGALRLPVSIGQSPYGCANKGRKNLLYTSVIDVALAGYFNTFSYVVQTKVHKNWMKSLTERVRDLYFEYF